MQSQHDIAPAVSQAGPMLRTFGKGSGVAFCWQDKRALDLIRESLDSKNTVATGLGVYCTLARIASDKGGMEIFQTTHAEISFKSGIKTSAVKLRLADLEAIGLIRIDTPARKAPCTYHLLSVSQQVTNDSQQVTSVSHQPEFRPMATLEEDRTNNEQTEKKSRAVARPFGEVSFPECLNTTEFTLAWAEWVQHLVEQKTKTTPSAFQKQIKFCEEIGLPRALAAINTSIKNSWKSIYESKFANDPKHTARRTDGGAGTINDGKSSQYRNVGKVV